MKGHLWEQIEKRRLFLIGGDPRGQGEVTRGQLRRQTTQRPAEGCRARLHTAAAVETSGTPKGGLELIPLTDDLRLSSQGSGRAMTSPGQAFIGRCG